MISEFLDNQAWLNVQSWMEEKDAAVTSTQTQVLTVTTSLTQFLERKYNLKLDVFIHDQYVDEVSEQEAVLLDIGLHSRCLRRKVSLKSRGEIMFDAESVLPLDVLPMELMAELESGNRPLAKLLSDRGLSLSRSNLSVSCIQNHALYEGCWSRRSVLKSQSGAKALVMEVFHNSIWRKIDYFLNR